MKRPVIGTPAIAALTRLGLAFEVHTYDHDPAADSFGLEAAVALAVSPTQVFKTLVVNADGGSLAVGVVPVDRQLDLKAMAVALGRKRVTMAEPAVAERITGYVVGGISPIGQKKTLATVIDVSATALARVYVSGGRRGVDLSLAPGDLVAATDATLAPIAR
ncbi:MAG TPA: Cys-tRNA(Pro) deacylase [Pedococcus sp.]|nr:Cys-tRNA(Pro) deacylase [Pedococcus sp.]